MFGKKCTLFQKALLSFLELKLKWYYLYYWFELVYWYLISFSYDYSDYWVRNFIVLNIWLLWIEIPMTNVSYIVLFPQQSSEYKKLLTSNLNVFMIYKNVKMWIMFIYILNVWYKKEKISKIRQLWWNVVLINAKMI